MVVDVVVHPQRPALFRPVQQSQQLRLQRIGVEELGHVALVVPPDGQTASVVVVVPDTELARDVAGVRQLATIVVGQFQSAATHDESALVVSDGLAVSVGTNAVAGVVDQTDFRLIFSTRRRQNVAVVVVGVRVAPSARSSWTRRRESLLVLDLE